MDINVKVHRFTTDVPQLAKGPKRVAWKGGPEMMQITADRMLPDLCDNLDCAKKGRFRANPENRVKSPPHCTAVV